MFRKLIAIYSTLFLSLVSLVAMPPAKANANCVGTQCEISFGYTGGVQSWIVPPAARNITFDIQGASGGRGGGMGGRVTGNLTGSHGTLFIYVGGAGSTGADVLGGFNGGGRSGGHRMNEGSGGGASDIRSSGSLESRIVVAGGGGGTGGYSGGPGGHGGNLIAANGGAGQGGGGQGGSQFAGGEPGANNGGMTAATAGSFGQGGAGGFSWNAGGGGGGGGWYGGGGGGADDDDCCGDGGGGGGGSSYASESQTQNVSHVAGYRTGHGLVIIRYELVAELVKFTGEQLTTNSVVFELEYNSDISQLSETDFVLSGAGCQLVSTVIVGNKATVEVQNCIEDPTLELIPNSIEVINIQPANTLSSVVRLDRQAPTMELSSTVFSSSQLVIDLVFPDAVNVVSTNSFRVLGCEAYEVSNQTPVTLSLSGCIGPTAQITLADKALVDEFGNASSTISKIISIDLVPAMFSWLDPVISYGESIGFEITLSASESVTFSPAAFTWSSGITGCQVTTGSPMVLGFTGCQEGEIEVSLLPHTAVDAVGHSSPPQTLSRTISLQRPAVPASPAPTPDSSGQPPSTELVQIDPVSESNSIDLPQPLPESSEADLAITGPVAVSNATDYLGEVTERNLLEADSQLEVEEKLVETTTVAGSNNANANFELASNPTEQSDPGDWYLAIAAVLALLSIGGIGTYLFRLAENNRSRSIK